MMMIRNLCGQNQIFGCIRNILQSNIQNLITISLQNTQETKSMSKLQNIVLYQPKQSLTKNSTNQEILQCLKAPQKYFPMKYVYDQVGSKMFEEVEKQQNYYLFSSDKEIIQNSCEEMLEIIGKEIFNLVDLGAGDGVKTKIILEKAVQWIYFNLVIYYKLKVLQFKYQYNYCFHIFKSFSFSFLKYSLLILYQKVEKGYNINYVPIDISKDANDNLIGRTTQCFPNLDITAITAFFEDGIRWVQTNKTEKNAYFFLGSTLGAYNKDTLHQFAQFLKNNLKKGDLLFVAVDIYKDTKILQAAYNNKASYSMLQYLLQAINKKTDCNFVLCNFRPAIYFQPIQRKMQGNLISKIDQNITLCNQTVSFKQGEVIKCMVSKKFLIQQIQQAFDLAEMKKVKIFTDKKEYMINYVCERK